MGGGGGARDPGRCRGQRGGAVGGAKKGGRGRRKGQGGRVGEGIKRTEHEEEVVGGGDKRGARWSE